MLHRIIGILKRRRAPIPECPIAAHQAVFQNTVERHLQNRKSIPDYMVQDPIYQVPKYVIAMCKDLCDIIDRPDVELIDVLRIEKTAVGHSDYANKLALRCYIRATEKK
jgi:hypothetical protein